MDDRRIANIERAAEDRGWQLWLVRPQRRADSAESPSSPHPRPFSPCRQRVGAKPASDRPAHLPSTTSDPEHHEHPCDRNPAPEFPLHSTPDQSVTLKEFRDRNVILAFYPADWSPVCSDQLSLYNELLEEFTRFNAQLLAIPVAGVWSHAASARDRNFHSLLSDFEPKGEVVRAYGVYDEQAGVGQRAVRDRRRHPVELRVTDGCEPGRRRHHQGAGGAALEQHPEGTAHGRCRGGSVMLDENATLAVPVSAQDPARGNAHAVVTLVEGGDFQCPARGMAYPAVKRTQRRYAGNLRFVFCHFPLSQAHPYAHMATELAEAAAVDGQFRAMHDWLYENQDAWVEYGARGLEAGVQALGLDKAAVAATAQRRRRRAYPSRLHGRCTQRRQRHARLLRRRLPAPGRLRPAGARHRPADRAAGLRACGKSFHHAPCRERPAARFRHGVWRLRSPSSDRDAREHAGLCREAVGRRVRFDAPTVHSAFIRCISGRSS